MFDDKRLFALSDLDHQNFERFVRKDHPLRRALSVVDWKAVENQLADYYSEKMGRPTNIALPLMKLEILMFFFGLSDREVCDRAETDMAFRFFLQFGMRDKVPHHSNLSRFRGRLGTQGYLAIFNELVAQARAAGVVKDRMRVKDASHVVAKIALPTTLALMAQVRDKLLETTHPFDPVRAEGEVVAVERMRLADEGRSDQERLIARIIHLTEILAWADELPEPEHAEENFDWRQLIEVRKLAHKVLEDRDNPQAGDAVRSAVDPEARRSKHGQWYDGYLVDITIDPDSEIITMVDVLAANGHEGANAVALVEAEQLVHGNTIVAISIDGAGQSGQVVRELTDPQGLNLEVYVPPHQPTFNGKLPNTEFQQSDDQSHVTCPEGYQSKYRQVDRRKGIEKGFIYRFAKATCSKCPLLEKCMGDPPNHFGRSVRKSKYQQEHQQLVALSQTDAYRDVKQHDHPKVERKLGELLNVHGGRRARYWGHSKTKIQETLSAMATNLKRMTKLLAAPRVALEP